MPLAYLASVAQTLPLQEEILRGMVPVVTVGVAVADAKAAFGKLIPQDRDWGLDDPVLVSFGVQHKLITVAYSEKAYKPSSFRLSSEGFA
jgi:hypothetical protein